MDAACARLLEVGRPDGLIASTDADSRVAPDWLRAQLDAVARGARAIGGHIELAAEEAASLSPAVLHQRAVQARQRHRQVIDAGANGGSSEHWQFSGASMALTAATYLQVGGLEPASALEDEALERALHRHSVRIERLLSVRVATSARLRGRAPRGLARDLSLASWVERRTYQAERYSLNGLLTAKRDSVSAVILTRNHAATVGSALDAVLPLRDAGLLDEIVVVDRTSRDATLRIAMVRGATVYDESALMAEWGPVRGRGDALWRSVATTSGELVVVLDADHCDRRCVLGLLSPLVHHPEVALVKGSYQLPVGAGRVTELLARPLLNLCVPELAGFVQPLAVEAAARRTVLEQLPFPVGDGVEIAMLIDAAQLVGIDALAQVDLGFRQSRHGDSPELSSEAYAVLVAALRRTRGTGAIDLLAPGPLALPLGRRVEMRQVAVEERPPLASLRQNPVTGESHAST